MAIGTTAALLAASGMSAGGSLLGGFLGRNKAKQIGTIEQQAAEAEERRAMERLAETNPQLAEAYLKAQHTVSDVGNRSADELLNAGLSANQYLDPYMQAGRESLTTLSQLAQTPEERFNFQFSQDDPSYQWRLNEGQKALERSAASRGTLNAGGTLKALTRYAQGAASQEYQAAFDRSLEGFKTNQAARQQRFSNLSGLAGLGYGAAGAAGQNLINTQSTAGNWRNRAGELEANYGINSTQAQLGNQQYYDEIARQARGRATGARTGSMTAASNAFNQGLTGAFNAGASGLTLYGLTRPAATPSFDVDVPDWVYTGKIPGGRGTGPFYTPGVGWK